MAFESEIATKGKCLKYYFTLFSGMQPRNNSIFKNWPCFSLWTDSSALLVVNMVDSTFEVNVIYSSIVHNDEYMLCEAVKESYFKLSLPKIFSNCYPNWFDYRSKDFLSLLLDIFHKFIDHYNKKLQKNWPDKPTPIDHLNYLIKNTVL